MLVGSAVRRVAIVGGVRIPFARAYSAYATASNQDMLTAAFRGLVERFHLEGVERWFLFQNTWEICHQSSIKINGNWAYR